MPLTLAFIVNIDHDLARYVLTHPDGTIVVSPDTDVSRAVQTLLTEVARHSRHAEPEPVPVDATTPDDVLEGL